MVWLELKITVSLVSGPEKNNPAVIWKGQSISSTLSATHFCEAAMLWHLISHKVECLFFYSTTATSSTFSLCQLPSTPRPSTVNLDTWETLIDPVNGVGEGTKGGECFVDGVGGVMCYRLVIGILGIDL